MAKELDLMLALKNKLSKLKQETEDVITEKEYFMQYYNETNSSDIDISLKNNIKSHMILKLLVASEEEKIDKPAEEIKQEEVKVEKPVEEEKPAEKVIIFTHKPESTRHRPQTKNRPQIKKPFKGKKPADKNAPKKHFSKPVKKESPLDPDSPFAALAGLKAQMKGKK
jgi:ribosomal protein L21